MTTICKKNLAHRTRIIGAEEILNPKHETNPKSKCSNVQNSLLMEVKVRFGHLDFENLNLFRI